MLRCDQAVPSIEVLGTTLAHARGVLAICLSDTAARVLQTRDNHQHDAANSGHSVIGALLTSRACRSAA